MVEAPPVILPKNSVPPTLAAAMTTNPGTDKPPVDRPLTPAAATRYQQLRGHLAALRLQ